MRIGFKADIPWRTVWVLSISSNISWGSVYYAFSVVQIPMQQELGWSKVELTGTVTLALIMAACTAVPVGHWIDRQGGRTVMGIGSLLAAVMLYAWSHVNTLTMYYVTWGVMGGVMSMVLYDAAFSVATAACSSPASARTAITMITLTGGLASTVFYPLTQYGVEHFSWRETLVMLAILNLTLCCPLHFWGLPSQPTLNNRVSTASATSHAQVNAHPVSHWTVREVLSRREFWWVAVAFSIAMLTVSSMATHLIVLLTEKGLNSHEAVWVASMMGSMQVLGRVLLLLPGTWLTPTRMGILVFALFPLSLSLLLLASPWSVLFYLFPLCYGLANGMITILRGTAITTLFGRHHYGTLNGLLAVPNYLARAAGPVVASLIWVYAGGYDPLLWLYVGLGVVATGLYGWVLNKSVGVNHESS